VHKKLQQQPSRATISAAKCGEAVHFDIRIRHRSQTPQAAQARNYSSLKEK
jgi:hypothetical protein